MPRDEAPFRLSYPLGFLTRTAACSALACVVGLAILRWVFFRELGREFGPAFYTLKSMLDFLIPCLVFSLLAVLLVASVAVFLVALFASHKVAGPLFRLQRVADHLGRRVLVGRIHLRAGDQGHLLASEINRWVQGRKTRFAQMRETAEACEGALWECERALAAGQSGDLVRALADLTSRASELETRRCASEKYP